MFGTEKYSGKFLLTAENIDLCSEKLSEALLGEKVSQETIVKLKIKLESVLIAWLENLPKGGSFTVAAVKCFGRITVNLRCFGLPFNPDDDSSADSYAVEQFFLRTVLENVDITHSYSYENGYNAVTFRLPSPKTSLGKQMVAALVLGVIFGLFGLHFFPLEVAATFSDKLIQPTIRTIMGILGTTAGIFIFSSLSSSICNFQNMTALKKVLKKTLLLFLGIDLLSLILWSVSVPFVFKVLVAGEGSGGDLVIRVVNQLLGIVPTNFVTSFAQNNLSQIFVWAVFIGLTILVSGRKFTLLPKLFNELCFLALDFLGQICKLLPLVIFLTIANVIINKQLETLLQGWKIVLLGAVLVTLVTVLVFLWVMRSKAMDFNLAKKDLLELFLLGTATGSRTPCLPKIFHICNNVLKLDQNLMNFVVPFSTTFLCYNRVIELAMYVFGIAELFGLEITAAQYVMAIFYTAFSALAMPAVPMANLVVSTILWNTMGFPESVCTAAFAVLVPIAFINARIFSPQCALAGIFCFAWLDKKTGRRRVAGDE